MKFFVCLVCLKAWLKTENKFNNVVIYLLQFIFMTRMISIKKTGGKKISET